MIGLARVLCRDANDVEDVVMDAFTETAARFDQLDNPGGYLRTAVVNGARRRARTSTNRQQIRDRNVISLIRPDNAPVGEHYLDDVLESLSEREHTALALVYYEGYSFRETAELMGEPVGTIKALVHRTLRRLRQEVSA